MKVFGHFDASGNVRALVVHDAPEGFGLALQPAPGHFVAELEGVDVDAETLADHDRLRELARRVRVPDGAPRVRAHRDNG